MRISRTIVAAAVALLTLAHGASAQAPEKRIALVIGNASYPDHALATSANDGGLIAQTLQAAGFDVAGARDLDGESLRRALRDFVQKVQASGPDTVAFLYVSGYGMQFSGENYVLPVDAAPARDTDVAVDGIRISDYVRQIQGLPLKAGIVVLDAARESPFAKGGQPIAGGLALVEPDPKIFTAFNAAPGTVAPPVTSGSYSPYAQALAEMIRTGGLSLPEVFDRVRLRVSETTQGAQIPWDTRRIDADIRFFDRAPDAPQVTSAIPDRSKPISASDASAAYNAALARDTLPDYEAFIAAFPNDPNARRVRAIIAARREAITWRRSYRVNTPEAYWSYLRRYPRGPHAADARRRLSMLAAAYDPPPTFTVIDYDVPPPPPDEIVYIERPYLMFSDPVYGFLPPPPPPVYFLPPPPPDFVVLAPPPPAFALFVLPRPVFVPFPAYVVPPRYVAPPPNNVIFANLHNPAVINGVINQPTVPVPAAGPAGVNAASAGVMAAALWAGTPALPPSVMQRATQIQQGQVPAPRGVVNRAALDPAAVNPPPAPAALPNPAVQPRVGAPNARTAVAPAGRNPVAPLPGVNAPGRSQPMVRTAPGGATPRIGRPPLGPTAPVTRPPGLPRPAFAARPPAIAPVRPPPVARVAPPPVARIAPPRPPAMAPRPPMQAMVRPPAPPRMAPPPRAPRPAAPRCPPNVRCR